MIRRILLAACGACLLPLAAHSQGDAVRLSGTFTSSAELYSSSGIPARRPSSSYRLIFAPTVTVYDQVQLPFEFYYTSEDRGFRQPFNQFGVNPHLFGWLTLHAGYYSATISEFTFGDSRLLGGGFELRPGRFRVSFLYGRSQAAVATDTLSGFRGMYDRTVMAAKLGYGTDDGFHIDLNFIRAVDDSASLRNPQPGAASDSVVSRFDVAPQENMAVSLSYGLPLFGPVSISGETAVSAYSSDTRSPEATTIQSPIPGLFTPRFSSRLDGATTLAVGITPSSAFSLRLSGRWVGPGFYTLGYIQMPNDVFESTIAPAWRLFNNAVSLRGSLGLRWNNLRNNRLATTRRTIGSASVAAQLSSALGVDLQYTNYGIRSNQRNDTLRIDNIAQSLTFSPHYTFAAFGGTSTAMVSYSIQDYSDFNVVTGNLSMNKTQSGVGMWTVVFPSSLSFSTTLMMVSARTSAFNTMMKNISETVGQSFLDNAVSLSLTAGYNLVQFSATDGQFTARLSASYVMKGWGTFTLTLMNDRYDYGDPASGIPFREYQGSLQYSVSL